MTDTIDYQQSLADLDAALDAVADEASAWFIRQGADEAECFDWMQRVYDVLDQVRARSMAEIDKIFAHVETRH
jgi:hypothetical protein